MLRNTGFAKLTLDLPIDPQTFWMAESGVAALPLMPPLRYQRNHWQVCRLLRRFGVETGYIQRHPKVSKTVLIDPRVGSLGSAFTRRIASP